jgi:hypothetical protein
MSEKRKYFESLKALARKKRDYYKVDTKAFRLTEARRIYAEEGVRIDYRPFTSKLRGLYFVTLPYNRSIVK